MKNVAVLKENGAFALFFRPHDQEFTIRGKKNANARGSARGGEGLGAAGIDWCITTTAIWHVYFASLTLIHWADFTGDKNVAFDFLDAWAPWLFISMF